MCSRWAASQHCKIELPRTIVVLRPIRPADAGEWINDAGVGADLRVTDITHALDRVHWRKRAFIRVLSGPARGGTRPREGR